MNSDPHLPQTLKRDLCGLVSRLRLLQLCCQCSNLALQLASLPFCLVLVCFLNIRGLRNFTTISHQEQKHPRRFRRLP